MKFNTQVLALGASLMVMAACMSQGFAQTPPPPDPVNPPVAFTNSTDHYNYLKNLYDGGTTHTYESVPKWEGLWSAAGNTVHRAGETPFLTDAPGGLRSGGTVKEGVLTPEYEAAFKARRENMLKYNEQPYDRLTTCEAAGMPRWLLEPYVREFVNTPTQSWWLNDLANDTRRVFINAEHQNVDNTHSPEGDSVGFWAGDMLIVHTVDVWPEDWFRGLPPTSNQFEAVEVWRMETLASGQPRIVVNATFYDELSLLKPLTASYTFTRNYNLEQAGFRIRHWDCDSNQNTQLTDEGTTTLLLPGEAGFNDVRGTDNSRRNPDLPADLPGQSRDPESSEDELSLDAALGN